MPLLMCPNDNAAMQTVERSGVKFDMCPTCRGVWLDRGELEALMSAAQAEAVPVAAPPLQQPQPLPPSPQPLWRDEPRRDERPRYDDRDRYDDRRPDPRYSDPRHSDPRYYKKKKRDSIFDIFDFD